MHVRTKRGVLLAASTVFLVGGWAFEGRSEPPERKKDKVTDRKAQWEADLLKRATEQRSATRKLCKKYRGRLEMPKDPMYSADCNDLPPPKVAVEPIAESGRLECDRVGGKWKSFSNTCRDSCSHRAQRMCGQAFSSGCDCGPDRCWMAVAKDKATCVANPAWYLKFP